MAKNINFIPANELPVAEGEEVSVLCLENGEMKQKPGASLGGGEKADLVLALTMGLDYDIGTSENTSVTIESGSLEAVAEALREGRPPVVKCKRFYVTDGFDTSVPVVEGGVYDCNVYYYVGTIHISFTASAFQVRIVMEIDDPEYLEVFCHPLMMTTIQVI